MALDITKPEKEATVPNIIVDRRLFLTADKDRLVDPDDPEAAFLWAAEGDEVTEDQAKAVGYKGGKKAVEPEVKETDAPEDKAEPGPVQDKAKAPAKSRK